MRKTIWIRAIGVASATLLPVHAAAQQPRLSLDDLDHIVSLSAPVVSPDGSRIFIIAGRPDFDTNRWVPTPTLFDVASGASRTIALGHATIDAPTWFGNDTLGLLATPDSGAQEPQLFLRAVADTVGPGRQVTQAPNGVITFAVSPDRSMIAWLSPDFAPVRSGPERFNDSFEAGDDAYLTEASPRPVHLWVQPVAGGEARRLTGGAWSLATSLFLSPIQWTPDGKEILFQRFETPHSGNTDRSQVAFVDVTTGEIRSHFAKQRGASAPVLSADGQWVVFQWPRDGIPANQSDLFIGPASGGEARDLTRILDRAVSAQWLPGGDLLLIGNDGTRVSAWRMRTTGQYSRIPLGDVVAVENVSIGAQGTIALTGSERGRASELYVIVAGDTTPRRLSRYHEWLAERSLGTKVAFAWATRDHLTADGIVTYPPEFDRRQKYPLVLLIHGGPTEASNEGWNGLAEVMAARGWIVFEPNYRGSNNRGNAFQRAIADDPGPGIDADVMSGIRAVVRRGGVDTTRMAASGWSFGGYVTGWLIGHHRWAAAVAGAPALDVLEMYALNDLNVMRRHAITGSPYLGNREAWFRAQSPLSYASRVRTPTLLMHDARDQRVTITQSYKFFHALRDNGTTVQFIVYPVAGHFPGDPVRSRDVSRRWIEWLARYLGTGPAY